MNKDAYYFPHFYNARNDRKIRRLRMELGVEGYGIYFMILEVLRDQKNFRYPLDDIDLLADEFKTSDQKVRVVICNYDLFKVDENEQFFSPKFIEYLTPYLESKHRNRISGIKGNLIKYGHATKKQLEGLSDDEILRLNENKGDLSGGDSGGDRNKSKVNESKVNKISYVDFVNFWNEANDSRVRVTEKKREQIRGRLKTFTEDEIKAAIRNRSKDEWINGEGQKYKGNWDSFWRNDDKIERYLLKQNAQPKVIDGGTW